MAANSPKTRTSSRGFKKLSKFRVFTLIRRKITFAHMGWFLSCGLLIYIIRLKLAYQSNLSASLNLLPSEHVVRTRFEAARNMSITKQSPFTLGNKFCILQPTLSAGREKWTEDATRNHIALRAFLKTFATTVTESERRNFKFAIYYGHDSDDPVFGSPKLQGVFQSEARRILQHAGFAPDVVTLIFSPLYGLHGRINAIWNVLAKDAYYDGCDYFFMSNDDMVFFTKSWISSATDSLKGIGSKLGQKRPCRYFGIVRFKDEWASWATFTFHVSTRLHMEIFGGVYYPVPYNSAHNDYWINFVYKQFRASKYRSEVRVRNRVDDVAYALAHPKDSKKIAPARYEYDKLGDARKYINEGRKRVEAWLKENRHSARCLKPL